MFSLLIGRYKVTVKNTWKREATGKEDYDIKKGWNRGYCYDIERDAFFEGARSQTSINRVRFDKADRLSNK